MGVWGLNFKVIIVIGEGRIVRERVRGSGEKRIRGWIGIGEY